MQRSPRRALAVSSVAIASLGVTCTALGAAPAIRVSGTVANGAGTKVVAVGPAGKVVTTRVGPRGRFALNVPAGTASSYGLMVIDPAHGTAAPVVLARSGATGYVRLSASTRALGTITRGAGFAKVSAILPEGAFSKAGAVALKPGGGPRVVPKLFAAVLRPKGRVTATCVNRYWVREPADRVSGFELLDQLYKQVWGNASITREQWDAITLPPTWLFWMKNSERELLATGGFLRSPECPADGQYSYKQLFGSEWLNLTNFKSLNQPVDEAGLITLSVMWKYHQLNYAVGAKVHTLTAPDGQVYIETSRDPQRTSDTAPLPPGWTQSQGYTVTTPFTVNLFGDAIANYRLNNGDSYQGPMVAGFTLAKYGTPS